MNRIDAKLKRLREKNEKALAVFLLAGDPDMEATERLALQAAQEGADLLEIGVPFSDPVAEYPEVQAASLRSILGGTKLASVFELCRKIRAKSDVPIILKPYTNTVFVYGTERFFAQCAGSGVDAVLVPDLPYEEREEFEAEANKTGVCEIRLIAPTSRQRTETIAKGCEGFLYCMCPPLPLAGGFLDGIKEVSSLPRLAEVYPAGTPEELAQLSSHCDGVALATAAVGVSEKQALEAVRKVKSAIQKVLL